MKKILSNVVYDTDKAKLIGKSGIDVFNNDTTYFEELYITKSRKYFIHAIGGQEKDHIKRFSNGEKESIIPITMQDAKRWAKTHIPDSNLFKVTNIEKLNTLNICVPKTMKETLFLECSSLNKSVSHFIQELVVNYFSKNPNK